LLDGGAIDNYAFTDSAFVKSNHCTFVYNEAVKRGGALFSNEEAVYEIENTIVALNEARDGQEVYGNLVSLGHNLVEDNSENGFSPVSSDITGMDPQIGGLSDHGGSSYTHQLQMGSPAIDAGSMNASPMFDQRGFSRVFGGQADIGAYEYDPATGLEADQTAVWLLFPNPAKDFVTLQWPEGSSLTGDFDISIYNLQYQEIKNLSGYSTGTDEKIRIELTDLKSGLYFIHILSEKDSYLFKLIIKK